MLSAVDRDVGTGHERRFFGRKIGNQTRDLFNNSATLNLVTVQASGTRLYLILEATAPGSANVTVSVAPPYPAVSAEPLTIVVAAP